MMAPDPGSQGAIFSLGIAFIAAFISVVLGRNLTRSVAAAVVSVAALTFALVQAEGGYAAIFAVIVAALVLAIVQLFGWMLVDVDRDHLPPTDWGTWLARSLAFVLVGFGLVLLGKGLISEAAAMSVSISHAVMDSTFSGSEEVGALLFGEGGDLAILIGLALASVLLASLMLLRGDGEER